MHTTNIIIIITFIWVSGDVWNACLPSHTWWAHASRLLARGKPNKNETPTILHFHPFNRLDLLHYFLMRFQNVTVGIFYKILSPLPYTSNLFTWQHFTTTTDTAATIYIHIHIHTSGMIKSRNFNVSNKYDAWKALENCTIANGLCDICCEL